MDGEQLSPFLLSHSPASSELLDLFISLRRSEVVTDACSALGITCKLQTEHAYRRINAARLPLPEYFGIALLQFSNHEAYSGSCLLFEQLESKCSLARTLQASGIAHMSPTTTVLAWDERVPESHSISSSKPQVLKRDGSSGGADVVVVISTAQANALIESSVAIQSELPFHTERTFIPGWVLQEHIHDPLLILGGRKFHARVYAVVLDDGALYVHQSVEYRAAAAVYSAADFADRAAHITNGAGKGDVHRGLTHDLPELAHLTEKFTAFVAEIAMSVQLNTCPDTNSSSSSENTATCRQYALLAFDVMADTDERLWLLEVNHNPAVPGRAMVKPSFWQHLIKLCSDLVTLLLINGGDTSDVRVSQCVPGTQFFYAGMPKYASKRKPTEPG